MKTKIFRLGILGGSVALTLAIHYGLILEPIFGHRAWIHAIHGRFCYIPIVIGASWFGLRGGLATAAVISAAVLPYILMGLGHTPGISGELVEIVFYFAIAVLTGALIDREWLLRKKQQQTQLQLEKAHKLSLIGQMAAGVAHEIKNPLASIKGAVEIISDLRTSEAEKKEFGEIAIKEIKRADGTVREFLAFARPKESKKEVLDLSATLESSLRQFEPQASRKEVALRSNIAAGIKILGDTEKVHQVLLNVLINALDASSPGSDINVSLASNSKKNAVITVKDEGEGISREHLERIFDPFFTTKVSGTGLGLTLVKSIVEGHDGSVGISSEPGLGTTVLVSFPIQRAKL